MNSKFPVTVLKPNEYNDWLNQRNGKFEDLLLIGDKKNKSNHNTIFCDFYSNGLKTNRDAWCYNFSKKRLETNMQHTIAFYNDTLSKYQQSLKRLEKENFVFDADSTKITWTADTKKNISRQRTYNFSSKKIIVSEYRPFCCQYLYYDHYLNERIAQMPSLFPKGYEKNLLICVSGVGVSKNFTVIMTDRVTDVQLQQNGQCFPLYYYEEHAAAMDNLFGIAGEKEYIRHDGITDFALKQARELYGPKVTKEDIFYYIYGFLHLPSYREEFAADLKKSLPRILFVEEPKQFWQIEKAGRQLANVHLNYENQPAPDGVVVEGAESGNFTVKKLKFKSKKDKSILIYNNDIRITHIPLAVYNYVVNGRSPVEWIMDRYQVSTHKESGITNDPNDWAIEHGKPRYILDLLLSVMTVSLKTQEIVNSLPEIKFE